MRKIVVALAFVSSLAAPAAYAADIPSAPPAFKATIPPAYDWSGYYFGAQIGYGWGDSSGTQNAGGTFFPVVPYTVDPRGMLGGGHMGYNYQIKSAVVGLEGDIEAAKVNGLTAIDAFGQNYFFNVKTDALASVRGRIGMAYDQWLYYATGGVAFGHVATPPLDTRNGWRTGWTVGAGVERIVYGNWSTRLEYRYTDLGRVSSTNPAALVDIGATDDNKLTIHAVRAGLSYRFNPH
jgi:outer membrane immunogenic protein